MPVVTDVSCEDMFADESDFEFDMENEGAAGTEAKPAAAIPLTAHTSQVLAHARFARLHYLS